MSIKNKKPVMKTKNAFRLKRIEEYLISQGYVQTANGDYNRWVDCVSNGRDISYSTVDVVPDDRNIDYPLQQIGGYGKDGYFKIENPRKHEVLHDAATVQEAVKRSRL